MTSEPVTGQVLPALPIPIPLSGAAPDSDLLRGFLGPLEQVHTRAYSLGIQTTSAEFAKVAAKLERDTQDHADAAARAWAEKDYAAEAVHASRAATSQSAAAMIRRTLNGNP